MCLLGGNFDFMKLGISWVGLYLDRSGLGFVIGGFLMFLGAMTVGCVEVEVSFPTDELVGYEGFWELEMFGVLLGIGAENWVSLRISISS